MHLLRVALLAAGACAIPTADPVVSDSGALDQFRDLVDQSALNDTQSLNAESKRTGTCGLPRVRREWNQRKAYTDAVLCLQSLPAKTPKSLVPGVRSRYDDFVATHINQTLNIHYTGNFLAWHRWFVWTYEEALRNECGYTGDQPYWNWGLYARDPASSPIFDGSDYSMSGNGEYIPDKGPIALTLGGYDPIYLPAGTGGGCVTKGPFKDMVVNLGPVSLVLNNGTVLQGTGLEHNPRCLRRDLSADVNTEYAKLSDTLKLILQSRNIQSFQMSMQGVPGSGSIGVHGGGHYTIGGDPSGDVFTSPGEPAFWLHHGMIDLVWWLWQNLDERNRRYALSGTNTFLNMPPSDETTLDDILDLGYAGGGPITIREVMKTTNGPFCYTYGL